MLDMRLLKDDPDFVREACRLKNVTVDVDRAVALDALPLGNAPRKYLRAGKAASRPDTSFLSSLRTAARAPRHNPAPSGRAKNTL